MKIKKYVVIGLFLLLSSLFVTGGKITIKEGAITNIDQDLSITGNVGIGTTGPSSKVHIQGAATGQSDLYLKNTGVDTEVRLYFENDARKWAIIAPHGGDADKFYIHDYTAGLTRLVIDATGNVGIGTTDPGYKLEVNGDIKIPAGNAIYLTGDKKIVAYDTAGMGAVNFFTHDWAHTPHFAFRNIRDNAAWMVINAGNVGIGNANPLVKLDVEGTAECDGTGCWAVESDISYKNDIKDLDYGLDEVLRMSPRRFIIKETNTSSLGLIAQELENIVPELVRGGEGSKSIGYDGLTPILVKAIQEQQTQIEELKAEIKDLKDLH